MVVCSNSASRRRFCRALPFWKFTQFGDVVAGEVLHAHGATALDVGRQGAELVEVDLVALKQEFADAGAQLAEDAEDGALAEHAVVLADVGGELAKADDAGELELGISFLGIIFMQGISQHAYGILNLFHGCLVWF